MGPTKSVQIMMIPARLNLAFFVTMSNSFPNTLSEIYLDVLVIGEEIEYDQEISLSHTETNAWHREKEPQNIYNNKTWVRQ